MTINDESNEPQSHEPQGNRRDFLRLAIAGTTGALLASTGHDVNNQLKKKELPNPAPKPFGQGWMPQDIINKRELSDSLKKITTCLINLSPYYAQALYENEHIVNGHFYSEEQRQQMTKMYDKLTECYSALEDIAKVLAEGVDNDKKLEAKAKNHGGSYEEAIRKEIARIAGILAATFPDTNAPRPPLAELLDMVHQSNKTNTPWLYEDYPALLSDLQESFVNMVNVTVKIPQGKLSSLRADQPRIPVRQGHQPMA